MSGFEVMSEQCEGCLFGPTPIVSKRRQREVLAKIAREDNHFICHLSTIARGPRARGVCCRGDYDRNPGRTNLMRIAGRLEMVSFVTAEALAIEAEGRTIEDDDWEDEDG